MAVTVARVRDDEAELVRELRLAALAEAPHAFRATHAEELALPDDVWVERARAGATGDRAATFVARVDGRPVGIVAAFVHDPRPEVVELVSMWTAPEARRGGAGRALVDAVVAWADAIGATAVELWVVRGNAAAQRLYESVGFVPVAVHPSLDTDACRDEIRLARPLRTS